MKFYIYNTLTRQKEEFVPLKENEVSLYTCGLTVYNYAHIGNLRTYIFEDILKKSLEYNGYKVNHVMNVTDVGHLQSDADSGEDKMAMGSKRENKSVWEIARFYEKAFLEDFDKLNIKTANKLCRATEHIDDMIALIKILEDKGYTYIANGNVYYSIDKFKDYNKFANITLEELDAGNRIEVDNNKKNPLDFVLWFTNSKFTNHIMSWDSPWGVGFPGWHIECSAMAIKYLGERIDIHCGGIDHIPVHHTNEIAQSEGALGHKWVNYWVHGDFLVVDSGKNSKGEEKMSKSSGDFLTVSKLIKDGFSALDYRYLCLQSRYRKQLLFSYDNLKDAQNSFSKLKKRILSAAENVNEDDSINNNKINEYINKFKQEINDDLNTPNAFSVLFEVLKDEGLNDKEKVYLIKDFDKVFSLDLLKAESQKINLVYEDYVNKLMNERNEARKNKDWALGDKIRKQLLEIGVEIIDSKEGSTWKIIK